MSGLSRLLASLAAASLTVFGWVQYPGWYYQWYSTWPELYAWPASFSNNFDPRWGFWFW